MGASGESKVKLTLSLFMDDLKTYQNRIEKQKLVHKALIGACMDTGAMYGYRCAKAVYEWEKLNKEEARGMKSKDTYKFLGIEEGHSQECCPSL